MEEKKQEEKVEEQEEDEEKSSPKVNDAIERSNAAAARQEAANLQHEKLIQRQEALRVEQTLGGTADVEPQKLDETPQQYAKRVLANEVKTG